MSGAAGEMDLRDDPNEALPTRTTDLAVIEGRFVEMTQIARLPADVLAAGRQASTALFSAMSQKKKKPVMMNGERYLEYEDWSLVTTFFGKAISTPLDECRFIDLGIIEVEPGKPVAVRGFEATAHLIDVRTGRDLASASMACLTDEPKWRSKAKYQWVDDTPENTQGKEVERRGTFDGKKRARVRIGEEPVPLFQLRSMAQTRAGSKLARLNYSWVAVLAGFAATPAEEVADAGPSVDRVDDEDLHAISGAWGALLPRKPKGDDAGQPDTDEMKKKREEIKALLRELGYKGTVARDLWADFGSRGAEDVKRVKVALGLITEFDPDAVGKAFGEEPPPPVAEPAPATAPKPAGSGK